MKTKVAVTDGVVALYRERYGEEWQSALECLTQELNRTFTRLTGHNVVDYPADDFPANEWDVDGVTVMFRVQGRGVPPHFILRGEWERLVNMPQSRSSVFPLWHDTFLEFEISDARDE